jgi:glycosyltransferase involved in cell wall biosynthesis
LVGDGPLEPVCLKLITEFGLNEKVELAGYQKHSKVYYGMFDIFMLSSHYEGLPYALLEAMSMGIPSVGTNVVGIKDLIKHGETGYLAEEEDYSGLADAVIKLLNNPELLSVFSENSKNISRASFNFEDGIKEYEQFYSSLCLGTT